MKKIKPCKLLLSLFLSFSFLFQSVFADVVIDLSDSYALINEAFIAVYSGNAFDSNGNRVGGSNLSSVQLEANSDYLYNLWVNKFESVTWLNYVSKYVDTYPLLTDEYDYYIVSSLIGDVGCSFCPDELLVTYNDGSNHLYEYSDFSLKKISTEINSGFQISFKLNYGSEAGINSILMHDVSSGDFPSNPELWFRIIPIKKDNLSENVNDLLSAINFQTDTLINGTDSSIESVDVADSANSDLKDVIDEYDSIEQSYIQDFNTNLSNINLSGFSWDSSFLTSAAWVTTQFDELVMETPFENLITFSLIIGITLYLIGRYKG